jgi:hypothetical protein
MHIPKELRRATSKTLRASAGFQNVDAVLGGDAVDGVSQAICLNCQTTPEMGPDRDADFCDTRSPHPIVSALVSPDSPEEDRHVVPQSLSLRSLRPKLDRPMVLLLR